MSRAIFVSCGGDPFLSLFMLRLFKRWQDEVDKLYICYNATIGQGIVDYLKEQFSDPKIEFIYVDHPLGFGEPIKRCLERSPEDIILLLEDDGFIYKKNLVNDMFQKIEGGAVDALGSPRFSCTPGLAETVKNKYKIDYSGTGDKGPNFWPNFFFVKREDLNKTDLNFAGKGWKAGDYIKELDMTCEVDEAGDTFVWAGIQLRALGVRFLDIPQNHASPTEIEDIPLKRYNHEKGFIGWIHGGSLSSGWNGFLVSPPPVPEGLSVQEFETRAAFWELVSEIEQVPNEEFTKNYKEGIKNFVEKCGLNRERIDQKKDYYRKLMEI